MILQSAEKKLKKTGQSICFVREKCKNSAVAV